MKTNNAYGDFGLDEGWQGFLYYQAPSETEMGVYRTLLSDDNTDWLSPDTLRANTPAAGPDDSVSFIAFENRPNCANAGKNSLGEVDTAWYNFDPEGWSRYEARS